MSDPNIAGGRRATVLLKSSTGLPEDVVVNTFHFQQTAGATAPTTEELDEIVARCARVYTDPGATGFTSLGALLSPSVSRISNDAEVRVYDLADTHPRPIKRSHKFTLPGAIGGASLPQEVALVGSFFADRNVARRRGRIYFGPFSTDANSGAQGRPTAAVRDAVRLALMRLRTENAGAGALSKWSVLGLVDQVPRGDVDRSPSDYTLRMVTNGWVDDSWDTQRRRGLKATFRTTW